MSNTATSDTREPRASMAELDLANSQVQALEQLLEVHERTALEQSHKLEEAMRAQQRLLASEREARAAQDESERRLRLALDAGRMGTWEWDIAHGKVIWSPEEERLYGIPEGSFSGTMEEYSSRLHPDDREESVKRVREAMQSGAPSYHVLHRIIHANGELRWLDSHAHFIYDENGKAERLVGVSTDVTERREIEAARDRALAEASTERQRLSEVFTQAPVAIAVLDGPQHIFKVTNPLYAELVGGRDVLGKPVPDALPEVRGQGLVEILDGVYNTGDAFSAREMKVLLDRNRDGREEEVFVNFVYQPLNDYAGKTQGILVLAVDVTDQVRARHQVEEKAEELARLTRELERSNTELDQFAYVASHDLKAPLRGIANLTSWIEEDLGDRVAGESLEHMQLLKGRVNRMEALIDGILAYSRAGRVSQKAEPVDVGKLLKESIELLSPPEGTQILVTTDMPTFDTERVPLQQVFMNLLGNAIKYAGRTDARIEVSGRRIDGLYEFAVADNGPGIAPQYREKIWQIFQTLAPRDKVEGTGIGLSVVRKIVEARGGKTWLDSEVGKGTTFFFTWPEHPESIQ
ncbi:MAG TPA: ATP-binding protein [Gemmatimonadaceae bacterium]|nr:ATP-binding protein [Gemmatimonadaceae bacterium]